MKETDKIIMSSESVISPRDTIQIDSGWKPKGLWYSFGNEWIDWVEYNMPEWKEDNLHEIELDYDKILRLGIDMTFDSFESKYGKETFLRGSITEIDWSLVESYGYHGIEIKHPWSKEIGNWLRTWDVSSGCIWNKKSIKSVNNLKQIKDTII